MSNTIKKSQLEQIIKEIVKSVIKEAFDAKLKEQSVAAAAGPISTPIAFKKSATEEKEELDEMTGTGAVSGYNVPNAFSKKGGSDRAVKASEKLGFKTTPEGQEEMNRSADSLY